MIDWKLIIISLSVTLLLASNIYLWKRLRLFIELTSVAFKVLADEIDKLKGEDKINA